LFKLSTFAVVTAFPLPRKAILENSVSHQVVIDLGPNVVVTCRKLHDTGGFTKLPLEINTAKHRACGKPH
jgi:hypothetical protein